MEHSAAELDNLFELSKNDRAIIVGSDIRVLVRMIQRRDREITSYQIAKDNLELRLARAVLANEKPVVGTFAGHWTY